MARSNNGRPPRGTHTLGEQLEELGRQNPDLLRWMVAAMDLLRARPGATRVLVGPEGIDPTLPIGEILKRVKAAKAGKPIRCTVDYLDGKPPVTVKLPVTWSEPTPRKGGRPRKLTLERFRDHCTRNPGLSDGQRARMLRVSRTLILNLRHKVERRKTSAPK